MRGLIEEKTCGLTPAPPSPPSQGHPAAERIGGVLMPEHAIKYRVWDGSRPVVLNGNAGDNRYVDERRVDLDVMAENLSRFGFGAHTGESAAQVAIKGIYNSDRFRVEILSITPGGGSDAV